MNRIPEDLSKLLIDYGAVVTDEREIQGATQYILESGSEQAKLNVYTNGSILDGGKESSLRELLRKYRVAKGKNGKSRSESPAKRTTQRDVSPARSTIPNATPRVGTDEAGKGDYFGPMVVAGVRVLGEEEDDALRRIGVRDSKSLGLSHTRRLAREIAEQLGEENLCVISLPPEEYESRREKAGRNINRLLGELNAEVIAVLQSEVEAAIVDEFGRKAGEYIREAGITGVTIETRPRAEDDAAVAAASILARARQLEEMDLLSDSVGFDLPRGATHVIEAGRRVVRESGREGLAKVAKISFSTTSKVFDSSLDTDCTDGVESE